MDRVTLISGREKARCTQVLLRFHLKKNGYQSRKSHTGIDEKTEAMISGCLVGPHVLCPRTPGELADEIYEAGVRNLRGNRREVLAD